MNLQRDEKIFQAEGNINIAQQHLWDAAKAVLVRKCLTLNAHIRKKVPDQ